MLLWEALRAKQNVKRAAESDIRPTESPALSHSRRLPYDKRCAALTRQGHRCKGRIQPGKEVCLFHDPAWHEQMRQKLANGLIRRRRRLSHLPDGYLKKLTNRTSVGHAMDRLYREIRLGLITPQMGLVMFNILNRLLDSGLIRDGKALPAVVAELDNKAIVRVRRGRADRLRPKVQELLTRPERAAWRKAVAEAPEAFLLTDNGKQPLPLIPVPSSRTSAEENDRNAIARVRQTAS